jgi:MoxR-like ATPase
MDRFLMHVFISYPDDLSEREVIRLVRSEATGYQSPVASSQEASGHPSVASGDKSGEWQSQKGEESKSIKQERIFEARAEIAKVQISEPMEDYIVSLVAATRRPEQYGDDLAKYIQVGVSPRGSIALDKCSRAHAWLQGRTDVTPDDIRAVINDCLRHRIKLSYEASADGVTTDDIISEVVKVVAVA